MPKETDNLITRDAILSQLQSHAPDALSPSGYVMQRHEAAELQAVDESAMTAKFVVVTRTKEPNRNGNMVQIAESKFGGGLMTEHFDKNPVVLFDHGLSGIALPVGTSSTLTKQKTKATADVSFSRLPHAEPVFAAVAEKLVRMASIGFDPLKAMLVKQDKEKLEEGVETLKYWRGLDFVESELIEWSITPIGVDRGALRQALDRGKIHDCTMPPFLRYSFQMAVGEVPAWSGWTPTRHSETPADDDDDPPEDEPARLVLDDFGVTIEGEQDAIDAVAARLKGPDGEETEEEIETPDTGDTTPEDGGEQETEENTETSVDPVPPNRTTVPQRRKPSGADLAQAYRQRRVRGHVLQTLVHEVGRRIDSKVDELKEGQRELQASLDKRLGRITDDD